MTTPFHVELSRILAAIHLRSIDELSWNDEPSILVSTIAPRRADESPAGALTRALQSVLYSRAYAHAYDAPPPPVQAIASAPIELFLALSSANASHERWDDGWRVYSASPDGSVFAAKGDRQLRALPGEFAVEAVTFKRVAEQAEVRIRVPRESWAVQPGFYFMFGETLGDTWDEHQTVRFYLNGTEQSTPEIIAALTAALNRYQVPFRMKALTIPLGYSRSDSMVLYVSRRYYRIVARVLLGLPRADELLSPRVPFFTRRLRPGVGVAEEPDTGESFGMHRCRLTAEGVVQAFLQGRAEVSARARAVRSAFASAGVDLDRPHLGTRLLDLPALSPNSEAP
jgi:hypothetical protein